MRILKTVILSFVVIFLCHKLYLFFRSNLTIPKTKDLVISTDEKYSDIYDVITKNNELPNETEQPVENTMKNELQNYIKNISINNSNINEKTI